MAWFSILRRSDHYNRGAIPLSPPLCFRLVGFQMFCFFFPFDREKAAPAAATEDNYTKYIQERPLVDTIKKGWAFCCMQN